MKAMILERLGGVGAGAAPLRLVDLPIPSPADDEILIRVSACGVCHTELDEIEGRTPPPRLPVVPGHQVVGRVEAAGARAGGFELGARVGVAWINSSCGRCEQCRAGNENLCRDFRATGRDANGGYAEYLTVRAEFAYPLPGAFTDAAAAPLLCAGAVGYRALRLTGLTDGERLGLVGFGASAHLVLQMARHRFPRTEIYVFTRSASEREFARELGAAWSGEIGAPAPAPLRAIIDTTPAWRPVVEALSALEPGGRLVINAIGKEESDKEALLALEYQRHLWREKEIKSVANVTRRDVRELLELAARMRLSPEVQEYPLETANEALLELKSRRIRGAKVLRIA